MNEFIESSQKTVDDLKRDFKEDINEMKRETERVEDLSMQNFSSWRDFLHKYFTVILVLIGATGILQDEKHSSLFRLGFWFALLGVFFGYIVINLYFYFERRWFQGGYFMSVKGIDKQFSHPKMKVVDNITEALLLHNKDYINDLENKIKKAKQNKDKNQITFLRRMIARNKKISLSFYFIGQHFELIEKIWLIGVFFSIFLTIMGTISIFLSII